MHCENSGSSDGSGASARSDRAKSEVFRDRSASAGGDTRYFSRCLIFWCFWIKPKAQKKNFERRKIFRSILREASRPSIRRFLRGADLPPFVTKRWRQKCPQGTSVGIGRRFSLSGHKRLRCCGAKDCTASTVAARQSPQAASALACCPSFCTPAPGARTAVRSDSSSGAMRRLLRASRNGDYSFASAHGRSPACRIALRKERKDSYAPLHSVRNDKSCHPQEEVQTNSDTGIAPCIAPQTAEKKAVSDRFSAHLPENRKIIRNFVGQSINCRARI